MAGEGWGDAWAFPLPWPPLGDRARRIALRPWGAGAGDAAALAAAWADDEVRRWSVVPDDISELAARAWIRHEEDRRAKGLAIDLVVTPSQEPSRVIGEVGLVVVDADQRWAELGYWLAPEARGQGTMASATTVFVEWVLRELPIQRLFARTQPENPRAGAVAMAAGLQRAGELETGTVVWIRDRPTRRGVGASSVGS